LRSAGWLLDNHVLTKLSNIVRIVLEKNAGNPYIYWAGRATPLPIVTPRPLNSALVISSIRHCQLLKLMISNYSYELILTRSRIRINLYRFTSYIINFRHYMYLCINVIGTDRYLISILTHMTNRVLMINLTTY
jgi:hypothetical protein